MSNQDVIEEQQEYTQVYPKLPKTGKDFRLHKINDVLQKLEKEQAHYEQVRKKYVRVRSLVHGSAVTTGTLGTCLTAGGIASVLSGPGVVIGVPLSVVGGVLGLSSAFCVSLTKQLTKKISKHEKTIQLITSKLNSINDLVSKALHNNFVDEKEFELIMTELDKYEKLKGDIRRNNNREILKKESPVDVDKLTEQIKEQVKKDMLSQLTNPKK